MKAVPLKDFNRAAAAYDSPDEERDRGENSPFLSGQHIRDEHRSSDPQLRQRKKDKQQHPESHQYEPDESQVWRHHQVKRHHEERGQWWTMDKRRAAKRWVLTFVIGALTGLVGIIVAFFSRIFSDLKFDTVYDLIEQEKAGNATQGAAFLAFALYNSFYVTIAYAMVFVEPLAAGSGISEIKCFLNGLNIPRIVRVKTLFCKVIGVTFSVAGGLPVGKEGPMIHSGSVIAAGVSQGKSNTLGFDTSFSKFQDFRNDREKRDFVACGAASGVAAAFGAPVGGVLFSLEEGASFWSTRLTWRCFFCAMTTVFVAYLVRTAEAFWGQSDTTAMFSFGRFVSMYGEGMSFSSWELSLFMFIGCMGGLIGALSNTMNERLTLWRQEHVTKRSTKLFEVLLVGFVMSAVAFFIPVLFGRCTLKPVDTQDWTDQEKDLVSRLVPMYCDSESQYNEIASLYLTDSDTAIKQMFHFRESGNVNISTFSSSSLFLFWLTYAVMACITYGLSVPSGLFVPSLLSGAAFGRLVGHLLHRLDHTSGTFAGSGTYALIGAAAGLGGMARMTISLTVILLEATGDMQYVLPLMVTLLAARFVGNVFNEGLYDIHIKLKGLAYLDEAAPEVIKQNDLVVQQIMTPNPTVFAPVVRVGYVYDVLKKVGHHVFPVVDEAQGNVLVGAVSRKVITTLMTQKAFGMPSTDPVSGRRMSPLIDWFTLESIYPRYPSVASLQISELERHSWLDLRPYMDIAPFTIHVGASVQRTYRMFRTLGLRHIIVINAHNQVIGMVTRSDLTEQHVISRMRRDGFGNEQLETSTDQRRD